VVTLTACTDSAVTAPADQPKPVLALEGTDVVRSAPDFVEQGRYFLKGSLSARGGCHFEFPTVGVAAGRIPRESLVELRPTTCEAIVAHREDPNNTSTSPLASRSVAALMIDGYDSTSTAANVTYGAVAPTNGSAFQHISSRWTVGSQRTGEETASRVLISYTKDNGCIQTARIQNYAKWRKGSTSVFSWGLAGFSYPNHGGDPCGTFNASGTSREEGYTSDCGWGSGVYTDYTVINVFVRVSDGFVTAAANVDIDTLGCTLYWDRIVG
jgi:hypothetical protein